MTIQADEVFAALSHATRLRCLMLLMAHEELCVCELTHVIGASQPYISRHLAQLRELGLVADRRDGQWIHYRIHPTLPDWIRGVLRETADGVGKQSPFRDDLAVLAQMPNRPGAPRCA